uniref:EH domain-containing protein n=1 Tax=Cebus imitator TaxID=2715852 RepID=A0A2K5PVK6_CEBIM
MAQIPIRNSVYESYYKQVDPAHTGRVKAREAAFSLKKSGLWDIILGKIWDLANPESKGFLDKQGFTETGGLCTEWPWSYLEQSEFEPATA